MYVLYAEDDDNVAELVSMVFNTAKPNITLIRVCDGASAFHEFRLKDKIPEGKHYSVVITDQDMPHMTGLELAIHIKEEYGASVPVILYTGSLTSYSPLDGVDIVIPKEQVYDLLAQTIKYSKLDVKHKHWV